MKNGRTLKSFAWVALLMLLAGATPSFAFAQNPSGGIEGIVSDAQGAVIPGASVTVTQEKTGFERTVTAGGDGTYRVSQLTPGNYTVTVTASNFKRAVAEQVTVEVGQITPLDVQMTAGGVDEQVTIVGGEATIDRVDNQVDGVVNEVQIANLPLNGRNFLDLARLQPGAEAVDGASFDPTKANYTGVSLGGQAGRSAQITVDGGSVVDNVVGTTVQNFSQEIISEFQIGLANHDVSSGAGATGTVNVITKGGSNEFHGSGYIYYRDDSFAAFPSLQRFVDPDLSDNFVPFTTDRVQFDREQIGGSIGGPIVRDKTFFFFNTEYNNQDSASIFNIPSARIQGFNGVTGQPFNELLLTARVDHRINDRHSLFGRYSHDDNDLLTPFPSGAGILPRDSTNGIFSSNSQFVENRTDGFVVGLTSAFGSNVVNDLRYNFNDFANTINPDPASNLNAPELRVREGNSLLWRSGPNAITPQETFQVRNQIRDDLTWTVGTHTWRFGGNWERTTVEGRFAFAKPLARVTLYGPFFTGQTLASEEDFLNTPVRDLQLGVGDDLLPFNDPSGTTLNNRYQFYFHDSWRLHPRFTFNYGLAYRIDTNLWNHDLDRPAILAPLFGLGTEAPPRDDNNFSPRVGFAWDVAGDAKTVVRGGFGIYYDTTIDNLRLFERADLGPPGAQLFLAGGSVTSNLLPGGDGSFSVTPGAATGFITLRDILPLLAGVRSDLENQLAQTNAPTSIEAGVGVSGPLFSTEFELPYSLQYSIGVQRELPWDMVVQADFNYRKGVHEVIVYDINRFFSVNPDGSPAFLLPEPTTNLVGPVPYADSSGFSVYKALLVRVDKRYAQNWQFTASYALSRIEAFSQDSLGLGGGVTDEFNLRADFGPTALDRTHRFVFSTIYDFPRYTGDSLWGKGLLDGWQVSLISTANSGIPFSARLPYDLNGSNPSFNTFGQFLPGTEAGSIGRDVGSVEELNALITAFNANRASFAAAIVNGVPVNPFGEEIGEIALLPADTPIGGDSRISQDVRVTKKFFFGETTRLEVIAEGFNIFNVSNTIGGNLDNVLQLRADVEDFEAATGRPFPFTTFRPSSRLTNIFGTGGPRAFQFALKFVF